MSIVAVRLKVMPSSPDTNLSELKDVVKEKLEDLGGKNLSFEEEPIAFGLKALIVQLAWPEERSVDEVENLLASVDGVSAVDMIDYRRAFG